MEEWMVKQCLSRNHLLCEFSIVGHTVCVFVDGIVKYMKGKAGPSSKELQTVADAEKFLSNSGHSIVGMSAVSF